MDNIKYIDDSLLYNKKTFNYYLNKFKNKKCLTTENYLDNEETYYSDNESDKTIYEKINTKIRYINNIHSKKKINIYKDDNFNGSLHIFKNNINDEYEYKRINDEKIIKYSKKVNKINFNNLNIFINKIKSIFK
jgi:hypothetical protein